MTDSGRLLTDEEASKFCIVERPTYADIKFSEEHWDIKALLTAQRDLTASLKAGEIAHKNKIIKENEEKIDELKAELRIALEKVEFNRVEVKSELRATNKKEINFILKEIRARKKDPTLLKDVIQALKKISGGG